jgi:hypothetical protein
MIIELLGSMSLRGTILASIALTLYALCVCLLAFILCFTDSTLGGFIPYIMLVSAIPITAMVTSLVCLR